MWGQGDSTYLRPILGVSTLADPVFAARGHTNGTGICAFLCRNGACQAVSVRVLMPIPTRKVSDDLSREALGLMGLTTRNVSLKSLASWL